MSYSVAGRLLSTVFHSPPEIGRTCRSRPLRRSTDSAARGKAVHETLLSPNEDGDDRDHDEEARSAEYGRADRHGEALDRRSEHPAFDANGLTDQSRCFRFGDHAGDRQMIAL